MNKKLFSWKALAGVALLAAFSMTSCQSDDAIDLTNPSGVKPTNTGSIVGGTYDWEVTPAKYTDFDKGTAEGLWAKAADEVMKYLKDNKKNTINVLVNVEGFALADETFVLPDFWKNDGTGANGKVVNITLKGKFKNADFERASAIKEDGKAFPVKIDTKNLKGAEVNFTFAVEKFDLELETTLTRSTLSGDYTIGYMKANAAKKLSATEIKSGTVEGMDVESTGDYKGSFAGVWTKTANKKIYANASGLYAKIYDEATDSYSDGIVIPGAKNIFVEKTAYVWPYWYNNGWNYRALGTVKFVQKAKTNATVYMNTTLGGATPYPIESIEGIGSDFSFVQVATSTLDGVGAVNKVTIQGNPTLKNDIFTDVVFSGWPEFNTKDVAAFDKVKFDNKVDIFVGADNTALSFNGVSFKNARVMSGINVANTADYYTYKYYQWIISKDDPSEGKWVLYKDDYGTVISDQDKEIREYNKDKEPVVFSDEDVWVADGTTTTPAGTLEAKKWGVDLSAATNLIKIATYNPADVAYVIPDGTSIAFDKDCKFWNGTSYDANDKSLNRLFGHKGDSKETWYDVTFGDKAYNWKRVNYTGSNIYWDLIPAE